MEVLGELILQIIEWGGLLAPLLFILFHLIRPLLFLPVIFICISGGLLFGPIAGSLYSLIGITLSSVLFYALYQQVPFLSKRISLLKNRLFSNKTEMTFIQIGLLRMIPFIHFHLLSLCLIEMTTSFREYTKVSLYSNMPLALIYTTIGGSIRYFSPLITIIISLCLLFLLFVFRKKEYVLKWHEFFTPIQQAKQSSS